MSATVRTPYCQVTIDGIVVPTVLSAQGTLDYGQRTGQATISVPFTPAWAAFRSFVVIRVGGSVATAVVRFAGFITRFSARAYPMQTDIICKGPLFFASTDMNNDPAGIDLSNGGAGQTDQAIVAFLLHEAGLDAYVGALGGTGKALGTVATDQYRWAFGQTALAMIDQLDTISLGYRTFESFGGTIVRTQITAAPGATAAATFTEGVDLEAECTSDASIENIFNQVQVTGYTDSSGAQFSYTLEQANPNIPNGVQTQQVSSPLLESSATGGAGISCQELAEYTLPVINRGLLTVSCQTPRDDAIGPGMTIAVNAIGRLGVDQNLWVQGMSWQYTAAGSFFQTLACLGYAVGTGGTGTTSGSVDQGGSGGGGGNVPPNGGGGGGGGSGGGSGNPPANTGPTVDFTLSVEQETVIVSGAEVLVYVVSCESAVIPGTGAVVSYAWGTSGGSPHPASGTDAEFTTSYAAISTQTITLTVTDANGLTGTATHTVPAAGSAGYLRRRLFLASGAGSGGTDSIEDFDGAAWRTRALGSFVVANGPIWASGSTVYTSADDLATAPHSSTPFLSGTVTALWFEGDASPLNVLAGSSNGAIARSGDGGLTWTIANAAPSAGNAVLRCVWSRYVRGQLFALTAGGLFRSDNYGAGWATVVAAAGGETFRDVSISFARIMIAMTGGRLVCDQAGAAQTLPTNSGDIFAIAADIRADRFYAYDSTGRTFYHTADGGTTMGARAALPFAPSARALWRDSTVRGLLFIALGPNGAVKSVDGFGSSGGYFQVRVPGVGSAPGGAKYESIGLDGRLAFQGLASPVAVASTTGTPTVLCKTLWNNGTLTNAAPPVGWNQPGYSTAGWLSVVMATVPGSPVYAPGSSPLWDSATPNFPNGDGHGVGEHMLFRQTFSVGPGKVASVVLQIQGDGLMDVWLNGTWVAAKTLDSQGPVLTFAIPTNLILPNATNLIAVLGQDSGGGFGDQAWDTWRLDVS